MSSRNDVETRVVQIQFDNKKFEKNISQTIKSTQKLDNNLKFKGSKKELKALNKSLNDVDTKNLSHNFEQAGESVQKFTLGLKDIIKYKVVGRVIDKMTDSAIRFMKQMSGIDNIRAGWAAYEEQITTIGGIVNNVSSKYEDEAEALEKVTEAMEKLQWYADETSFSFETMSNGIRQFTTAGLDLDAATNAAMGVTALAGASKEFDPQKINSAMNAVSKGLQTGYFNLHQWTTLTETSGIVTEDFSKKLLEAAVAEGTLIKSSAGQYRTKKGGELVNAQNIRDTLDKRWLTADVWTAVTGQYADAANVAQDIIAKYDAETLDESISEMLDRIMNEKGWSELTASHMIEIMETEEYAEAIKDVGYAYDELSLKAFKSSQQATSFTQAAQAVPTAIKTQFQAIFTSIFGGADRSTEIWTQVANDLNELFVGPIYNLEEAFDTWAEEGGAAEFQEAFANVFEILKMIKGIGADVFSSVFPDFDTVSILSAISKKLKEVTERLKTSERFQKGVKVTFQVLAEVFAVVWKLLKAVFKLIKAIWPAIKIIGGLVIKLVEWMAKGVTWLAEWLTKGDKLNKMLNWFKKTGLWIYEKVLKPIGLWFKNTWMKIAEWWENSKFGQTLTKWFNAIIDAFKQHKIAEAFRIAIQGIKDAFAGLFNLIAEKYPKIAEFFKKIWNSKVMLGIRKAALVLWDVLKRVFGGIVDVFKNFLSTFKSDPAQAIGDIVKKILKVVAVILGLKALFGLVGVFKNLSWMLDAIRGYFKARKIATFAMIIVSLTGSLWLLVSALKSIVAVANEAGNGKVWSSFGVIASLLVLMTGIMIAMAASSAKFGDTKRMFQGPMRMAIAIAALMGVMTLILKRVSEFTWNSIGKVGALFAGVALIMTGTFTLIRLGKRFNTPMILSFIKVLGFYAAGLYMIIRFLRAMKDLLEGENAMKEETYNKAVGILRTLADTIAEIGVCIAIATAVGRNKSPVGMLTVIAFMGAIAGYAYVVQKIGVDNVVKAINSSMAILEAVVILVTQYTVLMNLANLIPRAAQAKATAGFMGTFASIAAMLGAMTGVLFLLNHIDIDTGKLWRNVGVIGAMFGAMTGLVAIINAFSKVVNRDIKGGKWASVKSNPAVGTMLGMSIAIFAMIGAIKLVNKVSKEELENGAGIVFGMVGFLTICMTLIQAFSTHGTKLRTISEVRKIVIGIAFVFAELLAIGFIVKQVGWAPIWIGFGALVAIMASVTLMSIMMSRLGGGRSVKQLVVILGEIMGVMLLMIVMGKLLDKETITSLAKAVAGIVLVVATLAIAIRLLATDKTSMVVGTILLSMMLAAVIAFVFGLSAAMKDMTMDGSQFMKMALGLAALIAAIGVVFTLVGMVASTGPLGMIGSVVGGGVLFGLLEGLVLAISQILGIFEEHKDGANAIASFIDRIGGGEGMIVLAEGILALAGAGALASVGFAALTVALAELFVSSKIAKHIDDAEKITDMIDLLTRSLNNINSDIGAIVAFSDITKELRKFLDVSEDFSSRDIKRMQDVFAVLFGGETSKGDNQKGLFVSISDSIKKLGSLDAGAEILTSAVDHIVSAMESLGSSDMKKALKNLGYDKKGDSMPALDAMLNFITKYSDLFKDLDTTFGGKSQADIEKLSGIISSSATIVSAFAAFKKVTKSSYGNNQGENITEMPTIPEGLDTYIGAILDIFSDKYSAWAAKIKPEDVEKYDVITRASEILADLINSAENFDGNKILGVSTLFTGLADLLNAMRMLPTMTDEELDNKTRTILKLFELVKEIYDKYIKWGGKGVGESIASFFVGWASDKGMNQAIKAILSIVRQVNNNADVLKNIDSDGIDKLAHSAPVLFECLGEIYDNYIKHGGTGVGEFFANLFAGGESDEGMMSALKAIVKMMEYINSAVTSAELDKISQFSNALDRLAASINNLATMTEREIVFKARIDFSQLDNDVAKLNNYLNLNLNDVRAAQNGMNVPGTGYAAAAAANNNMVINVNTNQTYTDALTSSYDSQRGLAAVLDTVVDKALLFGGGLINQVRKII